MQNSARVSTFDRISLEGLVIFFKFLPSTNLWTPMTGRVSIRSHTCTGSHRNNPS